MRCGPPARHCPSPARCEQHPKAFATSSIEPTGNGARSIEISAAGSARAGSRSAAKHLISSLVPGFSEAIAAPRSRKEGVWDPPRPLPLERVEDRADLGRGEGEPEQVRERGAVLAGVLQDAPLGLARGPAHNQALVEQRQSRPARTGPR